MTDVRTDLEEHTDERERHCCIDPEDEIDFSPFFRYLESDKGHEVAKRVLDIIDDVKKETISHNARHSTLEKWQQMGVIVLVVSATTVLTIYSKFDGTIGVLFGTLVGYIFGKRK